MKRKFCEAGIQNKLRKNSLVKQIFVFLRRIFYFAFIYPFIKARHFLRKVGISKKYSYLRKYKNIHNGERCFIIATGPSLSEDDYIALANEYTFGVNAICKWFEKTKIKTNNMVLTDLRAYDALQPWLPNDNSVFVSDTKHTRRCNKLHEKIPVDVSNNYRKCPNPKKISDDIEVCVYNGNTVVIIAIQIAIYMGFKDIYLVGTDCNYSPDIAKWYAVSHGIIDQNNDTAGIRMVEDFKVVAKTIEKLDVNVYNATRGGMLEVFPRVNLDALLKECE